MGKAYDVLHVGIMVADMPLKVPCDVIDFTVDTIKLDSIDVLPGGDATNAAVAMARLEKTVALAAKIGGDPFGRIVRSAVGESGVDVSFVKADPSARTTMSVVLINALGNRSFLISGGSIQDFALEDIDLSALRQARHVNFGSLFAHPMMDGGGAEELFKEAKRCGATTSADVTHDGRRLGFAGVRGALRYVDYFMPSYGEARYLTGEAEPERMADFLIRETGDKTVIIKLGDEGCFVRSGGRSFRARPYAVRALDTTGAGDNFVAGFLTGLLDDWELERSADFANAVAGFSVQYVGATTPELSMGRVEEFMKKTPLR